MYEKPTGKRDGSKILSQLPWPSGFSLLPNGSGVFNEEYILMKYFYGFLVGEREGCAILMSKKGK